MYRKTYTGDQKNFDAIAAAIKAKNPELIVAGTQFEDGIGFMRALARSTSRPIGSTRPTRRRSATSTSKASAPRSTNGVFYAVSHSQESDTPGNPEFVAKYKEMFGGENVPEDAADAYAAAQVLQATVEANKTVEKADQLKLADWMRTNTVPTILGELAGTRTAARRVSSSSASGRSGKPEIVLPEDAATSDTIIEGYKPGGSS